MRNMTATLITQPCLTGTHARRAATTSSMDNNNRRTPVCVMLCLSWMSVISSIVSSCHLRFCSISSFSTQSAQKFTLQSMAQFYFNLTSYLGLLYLRVPEENYSLTSSFHFIAFSCKQKLAEIRVQSRFSFLQSTNSVLILFEKMVDCFANFPGGKTTHSKTPIFLLLSDLSITSSPSSSRQIV